MDGPEAGHDAPVERETRSRSGSRRGRRRRSDDRTQERASDPSDAVAEAPVEHQADRDEDEDEDDGFELETGVQARRPNRPRPPREDRSVPGFGEHVPDFLLRPAF
jgi:hypothetical protein